MRAAVVILLVMVLWAGIGTAVTMPNGSEPDFTKNIGPTDPRVDNPFAAALVGLAVAGVIAYGLRQHRTQTT